MPKGMRVQVPPRAPFSFAFKKPLVTKRFRRRIEKAKKNRPLLNYWAAIHSRCREIENEPAVRLMVAPQKKATATWFARCAAAL
jgi:hypothetical protein